MIYEKKLIPPEKQVFIDFVIVSVIRNIKGLLG